MDAMDMSTQENVLQDLGNRLRSLRREKQWRQVDMITFGLSYKYYQRLESGQSHLTHAAPTRRRV